jgi:hypothetical protein
MMRDHFSNGPALDRLQSELFNDLAVLGEVQQRLAQRLANADASGFYRTMVGTNCTMAINAMTRASNFLLRWALERGEAPPNEASSSATRH